MTDHWQVIEDALTLSWTNEWTIHNTEAMADIDAALAFVREQRRVPTAPQVAATPQEAGRFVQVEAGDKVMCEGDEECWAGIEVNFESLLVYEDMSSPDEGVIVIDLPKGYALCRWQEGDTPVAATRQQPYSHRNGESDEPTEDGFYWVEYYSLLNPADTKWGVIRHDKHFHRPILVEITAIYGPIPQPQPWGE